MWYQKIEEVFGHAPKTKEQSFVRLLTHTTSRSVSEKFSTLLQKLFCANTFCGSHSTCNLKYLGALPVLPHSSGVPVTPQGTVPWNEMPLHSHPCTGEAEKGKIPNHPAQWGEDRQHPELTVLSRSPAQLQPAE